MAQYNRPSGSMGSTFNGSNQPQNSTRVLHGWLCSQMWKARIQRPPTAPTRAARRSYTLEVMRVMSAIVTGAISIMTVSRVGCQLQLQLESTREFLKKTSGQGPILDQRVRTPGLDPAHGAPRAPRAVAEARGPRSSQAPFPAGSL